MYLLETVFYQCRYQPGKEWAGEFEAGIGVDFNQPRCQVLINHEVITVDFKSERSSMRIKLPTDCTY